MEREIQIQAEQQKTIFPNIHKYKVVINKSLSYVIEDRFNGKVWAAFNNKGRKVTPYLKDYESCIRYMSSQNFMEENHE